MEYWIKHECEDCGRKFYVEDDLEEPGCNECRSTNCKDIGIEIVKAV
ncbi:hypothetical protein [Paenibacillus gallinarum]|uniref:Uncharacterized protein n=1 Tax=Paenibacillus gallinarum TaxID=2762232 RepID=A0ABR8SW50_9BACL|nr:hypothetical protein [Paenibacillus gallinarum]MBD7967732.1 hypothetical protein [Paenibacillus gallinarum]